MSAIDADKSTAQRRAERAAAHHRDYVTDAVASGKTQKQILEALHVKRFEDKAGELVREQPGFACILHA